MSFQPILPLSGLAGWAFLNRTRERQETSFTAAPVTERDVAHFREKFGQIRSAEELVKDRRLLRVALGAFGLQDDIDNRAFIRKIIEGGSEDRNALANRLADKRYLAFAKAVPHLSGSGAGAVADGLVERIVSQYQSREFEIAVGNQDESMRLALSLQRALPEIAGQYSTETSRWYAALGNPPLRSILETSFGLPKEFAALDIDDQVVRMRMAARQRFGTSDLAELGRGEQLERLTHLFLVMSQLRNSQSAMSGASTALVLLQNARRWRGA